MKRLCYRSFCLFVLSLLVPEMIQAAEKGAPSKPKSTVLDFEADVIEGEKRKPDLFIQMEGSIESMDSVLYSRDDFNDYHELDRKWRPKIRRLKGGGAVKP